MVFVMPLSIFKEELCEARNPKCVTLSSTSDWKNVRTCHHKYLMSYEIASVSLRH